ncbi:SIS domain-containing protein [Lactococcus ileimucosae]|uniref:SIS domain-containing protein n=1 Tax=Lactococcus ileimucosae TaxID=2941329 RepID=A0ABV4D4J7_9LACT
MLEFSQEKLKELGAGITTKEILQQPELWRKVFKQYKDSKSEIESFLADISEKHDYVRVLFTGAGSSQYVGDTVFKSLIELGDTKHYRFESIGTTDIVAAPQATLEADTPTLLVSFGRSGNSPESVAAMEIVEQVVENSYQLAITCAKEGQLAIRASEMDNALAIVLPDESNDQGFAMTGSCISMTLMATLIFSQEAVDEKAAQVEAAAMISEELFAREEEVMMHFPASTKRVVYVGSSSLAGFVREAQLKILELTAGKITTNFDSSMGFRHGPKSFIDEDTVVFVYAANNPYTRQYDLDLYEEVKADEIAKHVVVVGQDLTEGFNYKSDIQLKEAYLVLPAFAFAQVISINAALIVGNTPDTPSASGTVNRVVKGVIIHPLEK